MIWSKSAHKKQRIPSHVLAMLFASQAAVLIPQSARIPLWLSGIMLMCTLWRWFIDSRNWPYPNIWLKTLLALVGGTLIITHYGVKHSLDIWCALLVLSFSLKILETVTIRDAYAVLFLAYFILCVTFIFDQSILLTGYQFVSIIVVTASMITITQAHKRAPALGSLKLATKLLLQSFPLMLILFIVFPRITPFWTMPRPAAATTGLATDMTPGDIANLTRSDEIVFRAVFEDKPPDTKNLYWRGLVYSEFNRGTWSKGSSPALSHDQDWIDWSNLPAVSPFVPDLNEQQKITYEILQEPSQQIWQYGLDLAVPRPFNNGLSWDFRLISRKPMHSVTRYVVDSYPFVTLDQDLPDWSRYRETRLPATDNPRTLEYAQALYQTAESDEAFIDAILDKIRSKSYRYTLNPPLLNRLNSVDQFWFDSKSGFCTHYAGAVVYLLRAVGIPARMVGGYQGGEINPVSGHIVVRQYHAHAWVEAWLPNSGWKKIDPTAAIAPERVESGPDAALTENDRAALSLFTHARLGNTLGLSKLMYWTESLEHRWNMMVVGYDGTRQLEFLTRLLGTVTAPRIAMLVLFGIVLSVLFATVSLFKQIKRAQSDPLLAPLQRFAKKMSAHGYPRMQQESYPAFVRRLASEQSDIQSSAERCAKQIEILMYATSQKVSTQQIQQIKKQLHSLSHVIQSSKQAKT